MDEPVRERGAWTLLVLGEGARSKLEVANGADDDRARSNDDVWSMEGRWTGDCMSVAAMLDVCGGCVSKSGPQRKVGVRCAAGGSSVNVHTPPSGRAEREGEGRARLTTKNRRGQPLW